MGLRPETDAAPLRMGTAFHRGVERRDPETAYKLTDDLEAAIIATMLTGYVWLYGNEEPDVETEMPFEIPLVNPDTNTASRTFVLAGKMDGIRKIDDTRLAAKETKTTSDDISDGSDHWLLKRYDGQLTLYYIAARYLGFNIEAILCDEARKPSIRPKQIPELDEDGCKITVDEKGDRVFLKNGKPRQSASSKDGWVLVSRTETPDEFAVRFLNDIVERPEYYFARREITRLEQDIDDYRRELWQQAKNMIEARKHGRWYRNVGKWSCGMCEYKNICLQNITVNPDMPPVGFVILQNVHPELEGDNYDSKETPSKTAATIA